MTLRKNKSRSERSMKLTTHLLTRSAAPSYLTLSPKDLFTLFTVLSQYLKSLGVCAHCEGQSATELQPSVLACLSRHASTCLNAPLRSSNRIQPSRLGLNLGLNPPQPQPQPQPQPASTCAAGLAWLRVEVEVIQ